MKIGVLTSSRADYSIYLPLLRELQADSFFDLKIIAFGTHLAESFGKTIDRIIEDGFTISSSIDTMPENDSPLSIASAMGKTITNFASEWSSNQYDLVFCLGDRYEMFAACAASVPFNVKLAHIHGGEQTTGAIDDSFRHSITSMSALHFVTTGAYKERVMAIKNSEEDIYNVGALSIDTLSKTKLLSIEEFKEKFQIDLSRPSILITFHPETVSFEKNALFADELIAALKLIKGYQFIITMPNADTMGAIIRTAFQNFIQTGTNAVAVESFGTIGYLSCMKYCSFMLGNTSSGFVEASYFPKYVINLGERQTGRILTPNIRNCPIDADSIVKAAGEFNSMEMKGESGIYGQGNTARRIVEIIKQIHA
jgi:GDP/UDP-N,N'-diacetylbacillosamine 2-epimerase (hydrolysing)